MKAETLILIPLHQGKQLSQWERSNSKANTWHAQDSASREYCTGKKIWRTWCRTAESAMCLGTSNIQVRGWICGVMRETPTVHYKYVSSSSFVCRFQKALYEGWASPYSSLAAHENFSSPKTCDTPSTRCLPSSPLWSLATQTFANDSQPSLQLGFHPFRALYIALSNRTF